MCLAHPLSFGRGPVFRVQMCDGQMDSYGMDMAHRVVGTDGGMGLLVQKVTSASNRPCDE